MSSRIEDCASILWKASEQGVPAEPLTTTFPEIDVVEAYAVQKINLERRISTGSRLIGRKVGLTSSSIQEWLGVDEPDFGGLMSDMLIENRGTVAISRLMQPRVEAEIAFVLGSDLPDRDVNSVDVIFATAFMVPAIEIIDSRIADWKLKIQDTIADNASSGLFVLGGRPTELQLVDREMVGMAMRKNGRVVSTGIGLACLGDPINAVVWLANRLRRLGDGLSAGDVVMSGALGPVSSVVAGDHVEASIGSMGSVSVKFE